MLARSNTLINFQKMENDFAVLILAAGESKRLGKIKQLLRYRGKSLLESTVEKALSTNSEVVVVLGAHYQQIHQTIRHYPVDVVENKHWIEGVASSIRCGLETAVIKYPDIKGVIMLLSDQPLVTSEHILAIAREVANDKDKIIATAYKGIVGVPAYIPKSYFETLKKLEGNIGAKQLINENRKQIKVINLEAAAVDIDTLDDWNEFIKRRD